MSERVTIHCLWAAVAMTLAGMALVVLLAYTDCDALTPTILAGLLSLAGPLTGALTMLLYRTSAAPGGPERPST